MAVSLDTWILASEFVVMNNDNKLLKEEVVKAKKSGKPNHFVKKIQGNKTVLFSSKNNGFSLAYAIYEHIARTGRFVFVERVNEKVTYIVAFDNDCICHEFELRSDDSPEQKLPITLILRKFLSEAGVLIVSETALSPDYDSIVDAERFEIVPPVITNLNQTEAFKFIRSDVILHPYAKYRWVAGFVVITALVLAFVGYKINEANEEAAKKEVPVDPYEAYVKEITETKPNVKIFLVQAAQDIYILNDAPGWRVNKMTASETGVVFEMESVGGTHVKLKNWAEARGYTIQFMDNKVLLLHQYGYKPVLAANPKPPLVPLDGLIAYYIDAINAWWSDLNITTEIAVSNANWTEKVVTVSVTDWSEYDLDTFGSLLNNKPFSFFKFDLAKGEKGLSGSISVIAYGRGMKNGNR